MNHQDWLHEQPSREHQKAVEQAVAPELQELLSAHRSRRLWQMMMTLVPVGATVAALWWINKNENINDNIEPEFMAMVDINEAVSTEELEILEDLDYFEQLEVLD